MDAARSSVKRVEALPGLPRGAISPQQQLEAVRRAQAQAEQRVALGMQLFKAAEAHVAQHRDAMAEVRADQERLREQVQKDVARTLQEYDQWVGQMDETFTRTLRELEERLTKLETAFASSQQRLDAMVKRAEALVEGARALTPATPTAAAPAPTKAAPPAIGPRPADPPQPQSKADKLYSQLLRRLNTGDAEAA